MMCHIRTVNSSFTIYLLSCVLGMRIYDAIDSLSIHEESCDCNNIRTRLSHKTDGMKYKGRFCDVRRWGVLYIFDNYLNCLFIY